MNKLLLHKSEILDLANGSVESPDEQKRIKDLIDSCSECRDFWDELLKVRHLIEDERKSVESIQASPYFNVKLRNELDKKPNQEWRNFWLVFSRSALALACVAMFIVISLKLNNPTNNAERVTQPEKLNPRKLHESSWAHLQNSTNPELLMDENNPDHKELKKEQGSQKTKTSWADIYKSTALSFK